MMTANTCVITAGVRLHGRTRTIPAAIAARPIATITSTPMKAIAFDFWSVCPPARSLRLTAATTSRPTASSPCAAAASHSRFGESVAERIPIVSLPSGHR